MQQSDEFKVGGRIRIVGVPQGDLWAYESGSDYLADTLRVLRWMVGRVFVIAEIDEFGKPWLEVRIPTDDGRVEEHYVAIMQGDVESWEHANDASD